MTETISELYSTYIEQPNESSRSEKYIKLIHELVSKIENYIDEQVDNNPGMFKHIVEKEGNFYMLKQNNRVYFKRMDIENINEQSIEQLELYIEYVNVSFQEDENDNMIISQNKRTPFIEHIFKTLNLNDEYNEMMKLKENNSGVENVSNEDKMNTLIKFLFNKIDELEETINQQKEEIDELKNNLQTKPNNEINDYPYAQNVTDDNISCLSINSRYDFEESDFNLQPTQKLKSSIDELIRVCMSHKRHSIHCVLYTKIIKLITRNKDIERLIRSRLTGWDFVTNLSGRLFSPYETGTSWHGFVIECQKINFNQHIEQLPFNNVEEIAKTLKTFYNVLFNDYEHYYNELLHATNLSRKQYRSLIEKLNKEKGALLASRRDLITTDENIESIITTTEQIRSEYVEKKIDLINRTLAGLRRV